MLAEWGKGPHLQFHFHCPIQSMLASILEMLNYLLKRQHLTRFTINRAHLDINAQQV